MMQHLKCLRFLASLRMTLDVINVLILRCVTVIRRRATVILSRRRRISFSLLVSFALSILSNATVSLAEEVLVEVKPFLSKIANNQNKQRYVLEYADFLEELREPHAEAFSHFLRAVIARADLSQQYLNYLPWNKEHLVVYNKLSTQIAQLTQNDAFKHWEKYGWQLSFGAFKSLDITTSLDHPSFVSDFISGFPNTFWIDSDFFQKTESPWPTGISKLKIGTPISLEMFEQFLKDHSEKIKNLKSLELTRVEVAMWPQDLEARLTAIFNHPCFENVELRFTPDRFKITGTAPQLTDTLRRRDQATQEFLNAIFASPYFFKNIQDVDFDRILEEGPVTRILEALQQRRKTPIDSISVQSKTLLMLSNSDVSLLKSLEIKILDIRSYALTQDLLTSISAINPEKLIYSGRYDSISPAAFLPNLSKLSNLKALEFLLDANRLSPEVISQAFSALPPSLKYLSLKGEILNHLPRQNKIAVSALQIEFDGIWLREVDQSSLSNILLQSLSLFGNASGLFLRFSRFSAHENDIVMQTYGPLISAIRNTMPKLVYLHTLGLKKPIIQNFLEGKEKAEPAAILENGDTSCSGNFITKKLKGFLKKFRK